MQVEPIRNRLIGHCDGQCGCQYFELLPDDRICIAQMSEAEQNALFKRNKQIREGLNDAS